MQVKIKRFDKNLPLPAYKSTGAACTDLYTRKDAIIPPGGISYIPLNIALEVPASHLAIIAPRSSTHKIGIMQANGIGIIDSDYCGNNDELVFAAYNFTPESVKIEKGTRLAQLIILGYENIDFKETDTLGNTDRGGFGSTGQK